MFAAISAVQVLVLAWSQPPQRGSPVSREMILMIGGRSWAEVPCPFRVLARRRGRSVGARCGVLLFPRVVVPLISFKGGPHHHSCRGRLIEVGLHPPPEGMELLT